MSYAYRDGETSARYRVDEQEREIEKLKAEAAQAREREQQLVVYAASIQRRIGGVAPVLVERERRRRFLRAVAISSTAFGFAMFCLASGHPVTAMATMFFAGRLVSKP